MGIVDRMLSRRRVYSGNTPVVSEETAALDPIPDHARIVVPESEDGIEFVDKLMAHDRGESCGHCEFFDLATGQTRLHDLGEMILYRILEAVELKTISGHCDHTQIGICTQWTSSFQEPYLVHATSPATTPKWFSDSECAWEERGHEVPCDRFRRKRGTVKSVGK